MEERADEAKSKPLPRKKRKLDKNTSYEDLIENWTQCCFLVPHKQRLCNIGRSPGSQYCGHHRQMVEGKPPSSADGEEARDVRVPCPIDPSHSVYKYHLKGHIKICNTGKHQREMESQPFYCLNCNGGGEVAQSAEDNEEGEVDLKLMLQKVEAAFRQVVIDTIDHIPSYSDVNDAVRGALGGVKTAFKRLRHVEQDLCIVNHLLRFN
eukprot:gene39861-48536_t